MLTTSESLCKNGNPNRNPRLGLRREGPVGGSGPKHHPVTQAANGAVGNVPGILVWLLVGQSEINPVFPGFWPVSAIFARKEPEAKDSPSKELNPVSAQTQIATPTLQRSSQGSQAQEKNFTGGTANISPSMTDR